MKIHEYQAKSLISQYGATIPSGLIAHSPEEAVEQAGKIEGSVKVLKAQIHAGGRGKGGGVKVCKTTDEIKENAARILSAPLITPQTGPEGQPVKLLLVEQGTEILKEFYFSILIDRVTKSPVVLASTEGGMDIEEVSAKTPEKILRETIDPLLGLTTFQALRIAFRLGVRDIDPKLPSKMAKCFVNLYNAFVGYDASLLEVNPLIVDGEKNPVCLDCKMTFDENALYRQKDIEEMRDEDEEDTSEIEAAKWNLNFIKLNGDIGCMVNGAGLAMATMDIIKYYGGEPANFLDVGGTATAERVAAAFRIITEDKSVKIIFINIFGGIVRCDIIAEGIIQAFKEVQLEIPVVVRLRGNNAEEAKKTIQASGMMDKIKMIDDISEAAKASVELTK